MSRIPTCACAIAMLCACGASDDELERGLLESGKGETKGVCVTTLPLKFISDVETSNSSGTVTVELVASSLGCTAAGYEALTAPLQRFVKLRIGEPRPSGLVPEAAIYRIPSPGADAVEVGHLSSMGMRSNELILAALEERIGDESQQCEPFSIGRSLIDEVFEHVTAGELGQTASNLSLVMELLEGDKRGFNRPSYQRTCKLDPFSGISYLAFLLDLGPSRADTAHLFIYRSGWSE